MTRPALDHQVGDPHPFADLDHAAAARALGVGLGQPVGVDVAVARDEGRADHAVGGNMGEEVLRLLRRDRVGLEAEAPRQSERALDFAPPGLGGGQPERADLFPVDLLTGFRRQGVEERDAVAHQPGQIALAAQLADQSGGVPGGAVGQLGLLQQQHVARAGLGQVVGDRAADRAAADDDDPGLVLSHSLTGRC